MPNLRKSNVFHVGYNNGEPCGGSIIVATCKRSLWRSVACGKAYIYRHGRFAAYHFVFLILFLVENGLKITSAKVKFAAKITFAEV